MSAIREKLVAQMHAEARAMASYALGHGSAVPAWVLETITRAESRDPAPAGAATLLRDLARAHNVLATMIRPARPDLALMLYCDSDAARMKQTLGQARITRSFMLAALISMAVFLACSLSPYLNNPQHGSIFESEGWPLFINELFFISSAALGSAFSNLFQVNQAITTGAFVARNESSYWVRFMLGIVAGLLLSTVLNFNVSTEGDVALTRATFSGAALALLGGFSSSVVQKVIQRMIEMLETVLRGGAEQQLQMREQMGKLKLEENLMKERMRAALALNDLQRRLAAGGSPEAVLALLDQATKAALHEGQPPQALVEPMTPFSPAPASDAEVSAGPAPASEASAAPALAGPLAVSPAIPLLHPVAKRGDEASAA